MPYDTITANGRTGIGQLTEDERSQRQAQMGALQRALQGAGGPNRGSGGLTPFSEIGGETQAAPDLADIHNAMVDARQQKQAYDASTPEGMAAGREQELFQQGNGLRGLQGDADRSAARFNNQMQEHDQNEDRAFAGVANDPVGMNGGVASDHVGMEAAFPGTGRPMDSARAPGGVATAPAGGRAALTEDDILRRSLRNPKFDFNAYQSNKAANGRLDRESVDKHEAALIQMETLKAQQEEAKYRLAVERAKELRDAGGNTTDVNGTKVPSKAITPEEAATNAPEIGLAQSQLDTATDDFNGVSQGTDPVQLLKYAETQVQGMIKQGIPEASAKAAVAKHLIDKKLLDPNKETWGRFILDMVGSPAASVSRSVNKAGLAPLKTYLGVGE